MEDAEARVKVSRPPSTKPIVHGDTVRAATVPGRMIRSKLGLSRVSWIDEKPERSMKETEAEEDCKFYLSSKSRPKPRLCEELSFNGSSSDDGGPSRAINVIVLDKEEEDGPRSSISIQKLKGSQSGGSCSKDANVVGETPCSSDSDSIVEIYEPFDAVPINVDLTGNQMIPQLPWRSNGENDSKGAAGEDVEDFRGPLRIKKFSGLEVLVSEYVDVDESNSSSGPCTVGKRGVAQRTRSHFKGSGSIMVKKKKRKRPRGSFNRPMCLDVEASESSLSEGEDDNGMDVNADSSDDHAGRKFKRGANRTRTGRRRGKGTKGKYKKRKRGRGSKGDFIFESMVNSMWKLKGVSPEAPEKDDSAAEEMNPIAKLGRRYFKFNFGIERPKSVKKTEAEKEEDELWAIFDFAKKSGHFGSYNVETIFPKSIGVDALSRCTGEADDSNAPQSDIDSSTHCDRGRHHLILDEQVGVICSFCSFVKQKIRYILPSFAMRPQRNSGQSGATPKTKDLPSFDGIQFDKTDEWGWDSSSMSKGSVWDIIPGIKETMFPHQQEGLEFLWKNIAGSMYLEELKKNPGSNGIGGCVISHAPGTGKTRLAIVFLQTYMAVFPDCRPLIVAPTAILSTWEKQFMTWKVDIPIHVLNKREFSGKEDENIMEIVKNQPRNENLSRLAKLYSWNKSKSVLGISYDLFKMLVDEDSYDKDKEGTEIRKILLEMPGILVLDEGHAARNRNSQIWNSLKRIKTERRIILSGTPFQNNFDELYNMLCIVRPKFHRPAHNSLEKLKLLMESFVHVHNGTVLENLPGLRDCLVVLDPLPQQKCILESIRNMHIRNFLALEYAVSVVSIHPSLLTSSVLYQKESSAGTNYLEMQRLNPSEGVKTRFVMELVRLSEAMNEKVLVFSQYIEPLVLVKDQLISHFNWTEGKEVLQMDGKISTQCRQQSIDLFNDPASEAKVLLASTRACSEGINLVGASRVVLLDIVWNPAVEWQAISRAYRIGQEKVVYTYTLITSEMWECDKYRRQAEKYRLSKLVFSSKDEHVTQKNSLRVSEDRILEAMVGNENFKNIFKRICYRPKEYLLDAFGQNLDVEGSNGDFMNDLADDSVPFQA
ncbi:DNA repair and recombination protein RAD54 [Acorus calamus]|uniref:DNA repair and recombination protein RAD54 n=1 Tax=Acorus calamus TaxID=4465 RepID=A0AAV9DLA9_ACOCL|nr:DNA repair and recombination protein RAD54 [Acorus calamus]